MIKLKKWPLLVLVALMVAIANNVFAKSMEVLTINTTGPAWNGGVCLNIPNCVDFKIRGHSTVLKKIPILNDEENTLFADFNDLASSGTSVECWAYHVKAPAALVTINQSPTHQYRCKIIVVH